ncbi:hypothetical protein PAMC26577_39305 [Caballeronia sordidicola]|uniref:Uncharacterized protein n=1 Tax=Caballeronia sordidicola TaxID=196367 RepID=A0A242M391_CABSO|nr:hypothetical protein PAMC26577_39305 [Caballeronia sordidicola]
MLQPQNNARINSPFSTDLFSSYAGLTGVSIVGCRAALRIFRGRRQRL